MGNFMITLEIMWKGMLGIFTAAGTIWLAVWVMGMLFGKKKEKENG